MLHLADAMLGSRDCPAESDAREVLNSDISFDVDLDARMYDFLHVSRLFDQGRAADGFKLGFKHKFFVNGLNREGFCKAKIEFGLISKIAEHAARVDGATLTELSGGRVRTMPVLEKIAATVTTASSHDTMDQDYTTGTVKFFKESEGYGFIEQECGKDVYFKRENVNFDSFNKKIMKGQEVIMKVTQGQKGLQAMNVNLA